MISVAVAVFTAQIIHGHLQQGMGILLLTWSEKSADTSSMSVGTEKNPDGVSHGLRGGD